LGIDDGIVIALLLNITFNLKLCTLPSVSKVAINNMVLDIVIPHVRATHESPLLRISSVRMTCTSPKLTRKAVEKEPNSGPATGYISCRI